MTVRYARKAIEKAINKLKRSYAFGILCEKEKYTIYAVRKDSPLIIGENTDGFYIASDVPAILTETNQYYLLEAKEIAIIHENKINFFYEDKKITKE